MPEKDNSFEKKKKSDRDLFTDEADIFGEEIKSHAEKGEKLHREKQEDGYSEDEADLSYDEEKPASPVRRMLLIAASIVVGIGLGVGGYFFFTAGSKNAPVEKKIVRTLPEPARLPAPAGTPSGKTNVIPEIPVKSEPQKPETAKAKEAPAQKAGAEKSKRETAPAGAAKSEKKPLLPKQAVNKETSAAATGAGSYYVQAGLFAHEKNAEAFAGKIRQKGFSPTIMKMSNAQKKTLYRVTVGNYDSAAKTAEVSNALRKQGIQAIVKKQ